MAQCCRDVPANVSDGGIMSSLPRISVLMPVYNGERFLRQAIASMLNQSFTDFEFLIIDDGSSDSTASIIRSFSDPRIRFFARPHEGLVAQLNFGIQESRTPLIARFDGDDIAHPQRLELQMSFLENHPDIGIVGSSYKIVDETGAVTAERHLPVSDAEIRELLSCHCVLCHPTTTIRKALLQQFGGYVADDFPAEDYGLWLRLLPHTKFHNLDLPRRKRCKTTATANSPPPTLSGLSRKEVCRRFFSG